MTIIAGAILMNIFFQSRPWTRGELSTKARVKMVSIPSILFKHLSFPCLQRLVIRLLSHLFSIKNLWHMRLGHPNDQILLCLFPKINFVQNNVNGFDQSCIHCLYGKMHNVHFPNSQFKASFPFELVQSDLWGPAPIVSVNGFRYYILFVDHYSRFSWLYPLKSKSEAFTKFVHFNAMVTNQFSLKIKSFRSDGGGEFTSNEFKS